MYVNRYEAIFSRVIRVISQITLKGPGASESLRPEPWYGHGSGRHIYGPIWVQLKT